MKLIPLTQGKFAKVDDEDYDNLSAFKWHYTSLGYAARNVRNPRNHDKKTVILMHRSILGASARGAHEVDHISGDKIDNRRSNLRAATKQQNGFNRGLSRNNTSGWKGVSWHRPTGKWVARLTLKYKEIYLGLFEDKDEAIAARISAAKEHHGEFFHA